MQGIKINKIAAIGLLMVVGLSIMVAQGLVGTSPQISPGCAPANTITAVDLEISIPFIPKVGEVFTTTLTVYCKNDLEYYKVGPDYKVCFEGDIEITEGREHIIYGYLKKGETRRFKAKMVIKEAKERVGIGGSIVAMRPVPFGQGVYIEMFLVDPQNGQYGTKEEWLKRTVSVFWKYNNVEPQWLVEPDCAWEESNRKIVQEMRKFEPSLSDSEALCLHQDNYLLIINAIGDANATDEQRIEHLLEAGWLEAQRAGAQSKEVWFQEFMEKNKGKWGGNPSLNFFRDNNSLDIDYISSDNSSPKDRITTTFIGTWRYQDHLYNKNNGLLWSYTIKPVKTAEVGIRAYWSGQGQIFVGWGSTVNKIVLLFFPPFHSFPVSPLSPILPVILSPPLFLADEESLFLPAPLPSMHEVHPFQRSSLPAPLLTLPTLSTI